MELQPIVEAGMHRSRSGVLPLGWRLQALVITCNVMPVLLVAAVVAYVSLAAMVATGLFSLFVGGTIVAFILGYAGFCLATAGALWRRRSWARFAAVSVLLLYILLHAWAASVKPRAASPADAE